MYRLWVLLIAITAISQLHLKAKDLEDCLTFKSTKRIEHAMRDVLRIDWKPISVFVRPAKRVFYRPQQNGLEPEIAGSERGLRSPK